jgi:methanogenic corrinoid protein MtbC1
VLQNRITGSDAGRILVGTVQGDIHYIGKNIVVTLLRCFGFTVLDAGEDVLPAEFAKQAKQFLPHVIGLSCLLNTSYDSMRDTIALLREETKAAEPMPRIIIGGAVDAKVSSYVAADFWAKDAVGGVRICQNLTAKTADFMKRIPSAGA